MLSIADGKKNVAMAAVFDENHLQKQQTRMHSRQSSTINVIFFFFFTN